MTEINSSSPTSFQRALLTMILSTTASRWPKRGSFTPTGALCFPSVFPISLFLETTLSLPSLQADIYIRKDSTSYRDFGMSFPEQPLTLWWRLETPRAGRCSEAWVLVNSEELFVWVRPGSGLEKSFLLTTLQQSFDSGLSGALPSLIWGRLTGREKREIWLRRFTRWLWSRRGRNSSSAPRLWEELEGTEGYYHPSLSISKLAEDRSRISALDGSKTFTRQSVYPYSG